MPARLRSIPLFAALAFGAASVLAAQSGGALPRSTPEREGVSSAGILAFVQAADSQIDAMHSFMLVRHGKVVAEAWWKPFDAATPHMLYSLSKSFTSTAVGLAIAEGKLSLDDQVLSFFPDEAPAQPSANLREMRVRDLLRMNTGQDAEPDIYQSTDSALRQATWVRRFLAAPVPYKPGTRFMYDTPGTYMLSAIVQKATGQTVADYLQPRLFTPLGMGTPTWAKSPDGVSVGGFGLAVRTEDIARFGQLYLQKGKWNGRQLVPASWVEQATRVQTSNGSNPRSDWDQGYGFQFWRSRHGFRGDGAFGQYVLVLPDEDAVIAITSGVRDMQAVLNIVWDKLLPAMHASPLADDPAARRALAAKVKTLAVRTAAGSTTSPLAARVSKRWFDVAANDRGIRAVALDLTPGAPAMLVRTASGEVRTPIGSGAWTATRDFGWGFERIFTAPAHPVIAASGAWTSDSVYTVKLVAPETPYAQTVTFRFDGDRLLLDAAYNLSIGFEAKLPRLEGRAAVP